MNWINVLKAPWVDPDYSKHPSPRIGKYIKYLENLLDENHRYGFKRWWAFGAIKTALREEGGKYKELPHEGEHSLGYRQGKVDAWKKKLEAGEVEGEYDPMKDPTYQEYGPYTRDLPSSGLEHMKAYYERNAELDSGLDIEYEKEHEDDPDSALEKANNEFKELVDDLGELIEDIRSREVHRQRDAAVLGFEHADEWLEMFMGAEKGDIPAPNTAGNELGRWTHTRSHHGWIINVYPHWLPKRQRLENQRRVSNITNIRIRLNRSQGASDFSICYMEGKKDKGEACVYKKAGDDTPFMDRVGVAIHSIFHSQQRFTQMLVNFGNTRQGGGRQHVGYVKEWHYLPEDSSWYRKGIILITRVLEELKRISRQWQEEYKELTHQTPGDTWEDTTKIKDNVKGGSDV